MGRQAGRQAGMRVASEYALTHGCTTQWHVRDEPFLLHSMPVQEQWRPGNILQCESDKCGGRSLGHSLTLLRESHAHQCAAQQHEGRET